MGHPINSDKMQGYSCRVLYLFADGRGKQEIYLLKVRSIVGIIHIGLLVMRVIDSRQPPRDRL